MINNLFQNVPVHKIFGTAGSGKTTELIRIVDQLFQSGVKPEEICFVSFTKKAVEEMIERMLIKFPRYKKNQFSYFKTLHALCFSFSDNKNLIQQKDLLSIAKDMGLPISTYQSSEEGGGSKLGDKAITIESLSRLRMVSLKDQWIECQFPDCPFYTVSDWKNNLENFKKDHNKIDFTDLLEKYNSGALQGVKYFIIDEAQDLSPLQWKVVDELTKECEKVYIAGDDDQAIYNWAGADVNYILQIPTQEETILDKTYRLPKAIYKTSRSILKNIKNRKPKEFEPERDDGIVKREHSFDSITFDKDEEYLILVRNRFQINQVKERLEDLGLLYHAFNQSSTDCRETKAIIAWERFRKTKEISYRDFENIQRYSTFLKKEKRENIKDNFLVPWFKIMNLMPQSKSNYFRNLLQNGYKFSETPKIKISTIHQAKGGECDNVILLTDMSSTSYRSVKSDDEHRVWYVAVSRAKKRLILVREQTNKYYKIYD
jgi:superfamily I DNA/RNA helicase